VRGRPLIKGSQMEYEVGFTIYGYIVVEAPSRNDAVEMYAAMSLDQITQNMKVNNIDSEHLSKIRMKGAEHGATTKQVSR